MKKILTLLTFSVFLIAAMHISASETQEESYDEDLYGPEEPVVWDSPVKGVIFEHKVHTMEMGLDCDDCHDDIFEMEAGVASESDDFTMQAMYDGEYCGACHDGETAFAANKRCTLCHIGVRGVNRMLKSHETGEKSH